MQQLLQPKGRHIIVDGRKLKNQIILQNVRKHAHYKSILDKQGRKNIQQTPKKLNQKFKNIQDNFLNQTVNFIIEKCKEHNVGTIVLGYNKNFQFKSNIGKKQNQYILTHSIQTIQTKTKNTMPNTRNKPDNTGQNHTQV